MDVYLKSSAVGCCHVSSQDDNREDYMIQGYGQGIGFIVSLISGMVPSFSFHFWQNNWGATGRITVGYKDYNLMVFFHYMASLAS